MLCGTSCAHRVLPGRSQLSFHCSTLTHSLLAIGQKRDETQEQLGCRDQTGKVCARNEFNAARRHLPLQRQSRVVRSTSSSSVRHPTAANHYRDRLPPSAACTQRLSPSSRHGDEAWIWPGEASRYRSTLVPGSNRAGVLPTEEKWTARTTTPTSAPKHRVQTDSFISYGCWEWTLNDFCWIAVESNEDDAMKGSEKSRYDFKGEVTSPWTHERRRPERTG